MDGLRIPLLPLVIVTSYLVENDDGHRRVVVVVVVVVVIQLDLMIVFAAQVSPLHETVVVEGERNSVPRVSTTPIVAATNTASLAMDMLPTVHDEYDVNDPISRTSRTVSDGHYLQHWHPLDILEATTISHQH